MMGVPALRRYFDRRLPAPASREIRSEFEAFLDLVGALEVRSYLEVGDAVLIDAGGAGRAPAVV